MSTFIDFFLPSRYRMRQYARRQVIGCIGGLIGLPLLCVFFLSLPLLADALQSADKTITPWFLIGGAVVCGGGLLAITLGALALIVLRR